MSDLELDMPGTVTAQATMEAITAGYPIIVNEGGARCFSANQMIITDSGSKPISKIKAGDKVLSHDFDTGKDVYATVSEMAKLQNKKPCVKIKLKSGHEIICTEDHKIYFSGRWHEAKEILSLFDDSKKL